ncbi:Serine/arginine-rich splicing factor sr30 [Tulasnella sp. 408]|nr:Serine/arginine-rich splicing factor sr30 [Tulasnella sp. 408]
MSKRVYVAGALAVDHLWSIPARRPPGHLARQTRLKLPFGGSLSPVTGLPSNATEEQVLRLFDRSGRIWRGVFKHGYAFLDFDTHDDARNAIKMHDGELFLGRRLIVEWGYSQPSKEDADRATARRSDLSTDSVPIDERSADKSDAEYGVTLTGLPSTAGYQELRGLVSRHCSGVKDVVLGPDARNAPGTAHVVFDSLSMARAAMRELNGIRLRGFRIQCWGMTPEEMGNLVKWGRIKLLPSSPVSRSSIDISLLPGLHLVDWIAGRDYRAETPVEHLAHVLAPVSGLLRPAIRVQRTPDIVPDTLTIILVESAPPAQACQKPIETDVGTMRYMKELLKQDVY